MTGRDRVGDTPSRAAGAVAQPGAAVPGRSKWVPVLGGLAAVAVLAVVAVLLMPKVGTLVITVSGPSGGAVDGAKVLVDGELTCEGSPCRIEGISAGAHTVRVEAPGYARPADRAVVIKSGSDEVVDFALSRGSTSVSADGSTGIRVGSLGKDLRLFVDGKDRGVVPLTVNDLEPGSHSVRLTGSSMYETYEEEITLSEGQMLELSPKLKAKAGRVTIAAGDGTEGAAIVLVCGDEKELLLDLPKTVDFDPTQNCRVEATKDGYEPFSAPVQLGEGDSEVTVRVVLTEAGRGTKGRRTASRRGSRKSTSGGGSITFTSIPASNVILDGRPIGRTPKRVSASPGRHSVVFMHPTKGRRSVGVTVRPGKNAMAGVRF